VPHSVRAIVALHGHVPSSTASQSQTSSPCNPPRLGIVTNGIGFLREYDGVMDATDISSRLSSLKEEMRDLQESNARWDRLDRASQIGRAQHQSRRNRLEEIKVELASMLSQFKRTGN
jgi:hypothetical protein